MAYDIYSNRINSWNHYNNALKHLEDEGKIKRPFIPSYCNHNAHMYFIKTKDLSERTKLINYLLKKDIQAVFHYIPLHISPAGKKFGSFFGEDVYTTKESERLLRLPLYYGISSEDIEKVVKAIEEFYNN